MCTSYLKFWHPIKNLGQLIGNLGSLFNVWNTLLQIFGSLFKFWTPCLKFGTPIWNLGHCIENLSSLLLVWDTIFKIWNTIWKFWAPYWKFGTSFSKFGTPYWKLWVPYFKFGTPIWNLGHLIENLSTLYVVNDFWNSDHINAKLIYLAQDCGPSVLLIQRRSVWSNKTLQFFMTVFSYIFNLFWKNFFGEVFTVVCNITMFQIC